MINYNKIKQLADFEYLVWHAKELDDARTTYLELFDENLIINNRTFGVHIGDNLLETVYLQWLRAFPNIELHDIQFNEVDDLVFVERKISGFHEGSFIDIEPSGKQIQCVGKTTYQFHKDKIVNYFCNIDIINVYSQLGYFLQKEKYDQQQVLYKKYDLLVNNLMKLTQNGNLKLTARELEILTCWLFGYSAKAIAALFHISVRTVESHIDHIKDKLSCHSKYDLQDLINSKNIYHLFNDLYLLILKPSI